jgi:hypothetical protein
MFESALVNQKPPLDWRVKGMLIFWIATLPITLPVSLLSGLAADAGKHWYVDLYIWSGLTYPLSVACAFICRRRRPVLALLPCVNIALCLFANAFTG